MEFLDYPVRLQKDKITFCISMEKNVKDHCHEFLELAYVTKGTMEHVLNGTREVLQKGDYLIIDYGVRHSYQQKGEEELCVLNCLFLPEFIDKTLVKSRSFHDVVQHYLIKMSGPFTAIRPNSLVFHDQGRIFSLLSHMQLEYEEKQTGYLEILRGNLIEVMIQTMRKMHLPGSQSGRVCDDIIRYVNETYAKQLSLSVLAEELNYSLPYLSRRFKEETGMNFCDYVQKVRIEHSCRLLANTEKNVMEIAQLVGYSDVKFFNYVFKKQRSMTPREFRALTKNGISSSKKF